MANELNKTIKAEIITGKDYLRMAKSESEATALFKDSLKQAMSDRNIIYVISEKDQVTLLPEGAIRILVVAELDSIKERFRTRMHGNLPKPVEQMLEKKHGMFDEGNYDFKFNSNRDDLEVICKEVSERITL
ncbi:MAG: hypothetical protein J1F23_00015 [Oscillospiraceae bacterium]|nr:hypothetical protein [Oscillospiraceae bacterium]